jgi:small subunit ribosomal protein S8
MDICVTLICAVFVSEKLPTTDLSPVLRNRPGKTLYLFMSADTIADFISNLNNAARAGKMSFVAPYSRLSFAVAEVLAKNGFVDTVEKNGKKVVKTMNVTLGVAGGVPRLNGVRRISKPSRRVYVGSTELRPVKNGYGMLIVSTTSGLMTEKEARKAKLGGEALFQIW